MVFDFLAPCEDGTDEACESFADLANEVFDQDSERGAEFFVPGEHADFRLENDSSSPSYETTKQLFLLTEDIYPLLVPGRKDESFGVAQESSINLLCKF